jgi:MSHA biogenesis protein MshO
MNISSAQQEGFTLVELVTVIVILGVLATSMTSFLRFGTQSYTDAADRDALISTARFVVERLNREVRNALPNSMRVVNGSGKQCLEFIPIARSATYLDIPVAPEAASNTITLAPFASALVNNSSRIAIYALNENAIYNDTDGVIASFHSLSPLHDKSDLNDGSDNVILTLSDPSNPILFDMESPTSRLYFIENPIAYCLESGHLYRYNSYVRSSDNTPILDASISNQRSLMAEYIDKSASSFSVDNATLQRNSLVQIRLAFSKNSETIVFNNEIQVPNVP